MLTQTRTGWGGVVPGGQCVGHLWRKRCLVTDHNARVALMFVRAYAEVPSDFAYSIVDRKLLRALRKQLLRGKELADPFREGGLGARRLRALMATYWPLATFTARIQDIADWVNPWWHF